MTRYVIVILNVFLQFYAFVRKILLLFVLKHFNCVWGKIGLFNQQQYITFKLKSMVLVFCLCSEANIFECDFE